MGYRIKRLQDMARGIRQSKELVERERWPRERLERFQQERLEDLIPYAASTHMTRRGAQTLDIGLHRLCKPSVTQPVPHLVER
jgi:hypothetical protein